ncbi:MAG: protease Do [Puniceicoccaceae bacterium]|nr:protease Do [Puniceicoccaceae bacterium]RCL30526.1 MAG: Do family serine endopeptidase [Puniceicoccaceae bacterium]
MNSKIQILILFALSSILFLSACGEERSEKSSEVSEKVIIEEVLLAPVASSSENVPFSYADTLEKATPSVVSVYTEKYETPYSNRMPDGIPEIFRQFGFPVPDFYEEPNSNGREPDEKELRPYGAGSGVIVSSKGYIVTNHHVVHDQRGKPVDKIRIRLQDKREFEAELIGSDQKTDVAVLKIEAESNIRPISVANSDHIRVGDVVFAIGNPLEVGITATQGIVSATGRHSLGILGQGAYENFIQTDASINLGNSGGALIDAHGRLIGINTAIYSRTGGSIGIGFAIPVNIVLDVMKKLVEVGAVPRGLLGLTSQNISQDMAEAFDLESTEGALVTQVLEGSPAEQAGIVHGDIIVQIDDAKILSFQDLRLKVSQMSPGSEVIVHLIREGELMEIPVVLGNIDDSLAGTSHDGLLEGVRLRILDEAAREQLSVPKEISGVLVSDVASDSPFSRSLLPNMIIMEVNREAVSTPEEVWERLDPEKANRLYIWYRGSISYLVVKF